MALFLLTLLALLFGLGSPSQAVIPQSLVCPRPFFMPFVWGLGILWPACDHTDVPAWPGGTWGIPAWPHSLWRRGLYFPIVACCPVWIVGGRGG